MDLVEKPVEQVESPVDVAHRIGAPPARAGGAAFASRSEIEHLPLKPESPASWQEHPERANNHPEPKPLLNWKKKALSAA
jgi:hypothetical protein